MSFPRLLSAPLLFAAFTALGCSSGEPTIVDAPYTLNSAQSGGFAGIDDQTIIDSSAKTITFKQKGEVVGTSTLSDAEIDAVTAAIEAADLAHPEDYSGGGTVYDGLGESLTFTTKGRSFTTILGPDDPDEVDALTKLVEDISTAHLN